MSPWKACDIRGKYPSEVNEALIRSAAEGIAEQCGPGARVLVTGDYRLSTPTLKEAAVQGVLDGGARPLDAGQVPTPVAYAAHRRLRTDAVLIITASHNPPAYNGLKFMIGTMPATESQLGKLRARSNKTNIHGGAATSDSIDIVPEYVECMLRRWAVLREARSLRLVLDSGNGAWSELAPRMVGALGMDVIPLFAVLDGRFPNRPPDCAQERNLTALRAKVQETGSDLGIAWDGDGDRVSFVDNTGAFISADQVSMLLIRQLVTRDAGQRVVYDVKLSDMVRRTILECGAEPLIERSGHAFLKRRMVQDGCALGCEASGHYFFPELEGGDDGLFTALLVTHIVATRGSLRSLVDQLPVTFVTADLRVPLRDLAFDTAVIRLRSNLSAQRELHVDGIRLETVDGFVLARPSVTEPVFTLRIEGKSPAGYRNLLGICAAALPEASAAIRHHIERAETL